MSLSPRDMDFIELKHAAAREIALAIGVPPQLLGIPGDATYANYQEANRAFWRQTIVPLAHRIARALTSWLGGLNPDAPLTFKPNLDDIEALSSEREALWTRLEATSFLTRDEKRAAAGYDAAEPDAGAEAKFNAGQLRVPAGNGRESGRWTDGGSGGAITLAQLTDKRQYSVVLAEEEARGGHAIRRHVGKSDAELLATLRAMRIRTPFTTIAAVAQGSFASLESANDLVNRVLGSQKPLVDLVARGTLAVAWLRHRFGYPTGREAFRSDAFAEPYMRNTYDVGVYIRHDSRAARGYTVITAYPLNQRPTN